MCFSVGRILHDMIVVNTWYVPRLCEGGWRAQGKSNLSYILKIGWPRQQNKPQEGGLKHNFQCAKKSYDPIVVKFWILKYCGQKWKWLRLKEVVSCVPASDQGSAVTHVSVGGLVHKSQVDQAYTQLDMCSRSRLAAPHMYTSQIRSRKKLETKFSICQRIISPAFYDLMIAF